MGLDLQDSQTEHYQYIHLSLQPDIKFQQPRDGCHQYNDVQSDIYRGGRVCHCIKVETAMGPVEIAFPSHPIVGHGEALKYRCENYDDCEDRCKDYDSVALVSEVLRREYSY